MALWTSRSSGALPKNVAAELQSLLDNLATAPRFIEAAKRHPASESPGAVISNLSKELEVSVEILRAVFNALENLKNLSDEYGGVLTALNEVIEGLDSKLSEAITARRDELIRVIETYSDDNAITISYKAQRLTYLREAVYQDADLITDARPVFNAKGDEVLEYLITHYLAATYFRHGRMEQIHLAMDMADVVKLRRVCDRVIVKSQTLKKELGSKAKILRDDDATA